ncbi:MAG: QueT transporter family protein [Oscillospiraceae bacterium]|nr:QueT transporter family protein [Oscillospiraceae bacterium]
MNDSNSISSPKNRNIAKDLAIGGVVAAVYVVLTILNPFAYGTVQFRVSEILVLLCFYSPKFIMPLIVGTLVANLLGSPFGAFDVVLGTAGTAFAVIPMAKVKNIWIAGMFPVITNAILVGAMITIFSITELTTLEEANRQFLIYAGYVGLGQFVVIICVGVPLFRFGLSKNRRFAELLK